MSKAKTKTKTKTKTFIFVLEAPRDQDPVLEDYITGSVRRVLQCECRFWASPIAVIIANKAMAPWMREKVANGVFQAMEFCCLAFYLVCIHVALKLQFVIDIQIQCINTEFV